MNQNYRLPEEVLKEIGIEVFEYEKFDYTKSEVARFEPEMFVAEQFRVSTIEFSFLRRGVIGVSQIGYMG